MSCSTAIAPAHTRPFGQAFGMLALVLGAAAMGVSPTLVRLADVGPFTSAFWRAALALPLLYAWMRVAERRSPPDAPRQSFARPTVFAGLAFGADLFLWHLSIVRTTIANATFFATLAPIWVVIFGWLLFRHTVSRNVLGGLALCLGGGTALVAQSFTAAPGHVVGDLWAVVTGVFFGLYFLAVGAARDRAGAARVTFEMTAVAVVLLLGAALTLEHQFLPRSLAGWEVLVSLAVVSHTGGQGLLTIALGILPTVFSSLVIFLEAIIAALVAWGVLGEAVTPVQGAGAVLIVAGILVARPRPAPGTAEP